MFLDPYLICLSNKPCFTLLHGLCSSHSSKSAARAVTQKTSTGAVVDMASDVASVLPLSEVISRLSFVFYHQIAVEMEYTGHAWKATQRGHVSVPLPSGGWNAIK